MKHKHLKSFVLIVSMLFISCNIKSDKSVDTVSNEKPSDVIIETETPIPLKDKIDEQSDSITITENKKKIVIEWLNEKFGHDRAPLEKQYYSFVCFLQLNNDGKFKLKTFRKYNEHPTYTLPNEKDEIIGNLSDLRYNSITSEIDDNIIFFYATCDGNNCVQSILNPTAKFTKQVLLGMIEKDIENDIENRSKKAFEDAIKLFGGKTEAY
jgi:hypothetical protein